MLYKITIRAKYQKGTDGPGEGAKKFFLSLVSRCYALAPRCYATGSMFRCRSKSVMTQ